MLEITGLEELNRKLKDLAARAQELDGQHNVPLRELMPPDFLSRCSSFATIDDLFESSPFKIATPEDFAAIPDAEWDQYIAQNTSFNSWRAMQEEAVQAWTARRLGF